MYMISQGPLFLSRVLDPKVWDNPPPLIIDNLKYEAIEDSMDEAMERYFEYWYRHTLHRSSSTPRCSTMDQPNVGLLWLIERHPSLLHEGGADLTHRELHPMRKNGIFIWDEVRLDAMDFFIRESRALEEAGAACTRCVDRTMTFNQPGWFNLTRRMSFDRDRKVMVTARVERWPEGKKSGT